MISEEQKKLAVDLFKECEQDQKELSQHLLDAGIGGSVVDGMANVVFKSAMRRAVRQVFIDDLGDHLAHVAAMTHWMFEQLKDVGFTPEEALTLSGRYLSDSGLSVEDDVE